jgi:hypothetical protein
MTNKQAAVGNDTDDSLNLELSFPDPARLLTPYRSMELTSSEVLVALDTNVLLLPYQATPEDLRAIAGAYKALAEADRLFVPARAIREFAKHRERRLAEMISTLNNIKSRLPILEKRISPLLVGVKGYDVLEAAHEELMTARANYSRALEPLITMIRGWRGDDPVSQLYSEVFKNECIVEPVDGLEQLEADWKARSLSKRPPGYKDASKADGGIGDFLIWKSVLTIGEQHRKDLVFVTNERKSDWYVRSGSEPLYPRMELVDEYRSVSGGRNFRLCSLHELLKELDVDSSVVAEVERVETANAAIQVVSAGSAATDLGLVMSGFARCRYLFEPAETEIFGPRSSFVLRFQSVMPDRVKLSAPLSRRIALIRSPAPRGRILMDALDTSSRTIELVVGDGFAVENVDGSVLAAVVSDLGYVGGLLETGEILCQYNVYQLNGVGVFP